MYFKEFPNLFYKFRINGNDVIKIVKDITANVRIRTQVLSNIAMYDTYNIRDGETPEIIASKLYNNPQLHWIIMLVNEKYDYLNDYPLDQRQFDDYMTFKYNTFECTSWTNSGTDIIATLVDHGISADELPLSCTVSNAYSITTNTTTGEETTAIDSGINGTRSITAVSDDTITFSSSYVSTNKTVTGGLTITTSSREERVKEYYSGNFVVDAGAEGATARTYRAWEELENEKKRTIKIVSPNIVRGFVAQLQSLL